MRILLLTVAVLFAAARPAPAAEPPTADELALRLLDSEALYTVTSGLKPLSDGFWTTRFPAGKGVPPEVETVRRRLASLPLGAEFDTGVLVFASAFEGRLTASAFVAHRKSLQALVERHRDVFVPLGITAATPAQQIMEKIDRAGEASRWRCFGLVFGYPEHAVEFFVAAGEEQARTGKPVAREFVQIPTYASARGRFVYAVPKGYAEQNVDRALRDAATPVLARYTRWREVYIGEGRAGPTALLRDWVTPPALVSTAPVSKNVWASRDCRPPRVVIRRHCR